MSLLSPATNAGEMIEESLHSASSPVAREEELNAFAEDVEDVRARAERLETLIEKLERSGGGDS